MIEQLIDDALTAAWNFALAHVARDAGGEDRIAEAQAEVRMTRAELIAFIREMTEPAEISPPAQSGEGNGGYTSLNGIAPVGLTPV